MSPDPLSDIVRLSDARCVVTRCMEAQGDWRYRFRAPQQVKFIAVTRGACWAELDGAAPTRLQGGDVVMLTAGQPFGLASDLALPIEAGDGLFTATAPGACLQADFQAICGHIGLDEVRGWLLADALPDMVLVRRDAPEAAMMCWLLDQLVVELDAARPGATLATEQLAQLLFIHVVRTYVGEPGPRPASWIGALADDRIARALRLMHERPAENWRVDQLAASAAMSRTSFAVRFSAAVGISPLAYLTSLRMQLADHLLRSTSASVGEVAHAVGFATTSAFSAAFRRAFGISPKARRRIEAAGR